MAIVVEAIQVGGPLHCTTDDGEPATIALRENGLTFAHLCDAHARALYASLGAALGVPPPRLGHNFAARGFADGRCRQALYCFRSRSEHTGRRKRRPVTDEGGGE